MQKHKFSITCSGVPFVEFVPVPPEHKNECIEVSRPGRTERHYTTRRSHWMQKHKFGVTYLGALFMETTPGPLEHEK
jgi:hypothetical protein